jgi:hypothetical protein
LSNIMADKRESFWARRLALGGRMLPRLCLLAAWLILAPGAGLAQEAGLKSGAASLAAGKYSDAVRQLSATINSDNASQGDAAKALYLRGIAYRKMGESARAAADLGAAIWLGLPEPDRVKALVNRGLAFRAAGLSKEGEAELASARKLGGSREVDQLIADGGGAPASAAAVAAFSTEVRPEGAATASTETRRSWFPSFGQSGSDAAPAPEPQAPPTRTASASPQWTTTTSKPGETAAPATSKPGEAAAPGAWNTSVAGAEEPSSSSGGNRFTRWFGSRSDSSPSAAPKPAPAAETAAAPPPPSKPPSSAAAATSNWSTTTEGASGAEAGGETKRSWRIFGRTAEAEPTAPAAQPAASGGFQLQLANSRSEDEAKALWKKVSQSQGLAGVSPAIEKIDIGNFGTFYSLKIGPFPDKAQSVKVCNALKRSGIDCSPVTL